MLRYSLLTGLSLPVAHGLCLDPPYSNFIETITRLVYVDDSQIDFSQVLQGIACDSTSGPMCPSIFGEEPSRPAHLILGTDTLQKTLGIPKELSLSLSGQNTKVSFAHRNFPFRSARIDSLNQGTLQGTTAPLYEMGKVGGVGMFWRGSWYRDVSGAVFIPSKSDPISSIEFGQPVVIQKIDLCETGGSPVFVIGRLRGKEQWRTQIGGKSSLLGQQLFARWRGNGSLYRATVMSDEGELGYHVSWKDGDLSHRSIHPSEIVSVVQGHAQYIKSIDEILIIGSQSDATYQLRDLVVSVGAGAGVHVPLIRSGGGLVFEDDVSPAALLYSVDELMTRKLRMKEADLTSSHRVSSQLVHALRPHAEQLLSFLNVKPHARESLRNFALFLKTTKSDDMIVVFERFLRPDIISKFVNLNDMFNAWLDSPVARDDGTITAANLRFQAWTQLHMHARSPSHELILSAGDSFRSELACTSDPLSKHIAFFVRDSRRVSESMSTLALTVSITTGPGTRSYQLEAKLYHSLALLYIPATAEMKFPLSLVVSRVETLAMVELIGSVEYLGCGGLVMSPVQLSEETKVWAQMRNAEDAWVKHATRIISKFNAVLIQVNASVPSPSAGASDLFR